MTNQQQIRQNALKKQIQNNIQIKNFNLEGRDLNIEENCNTQILIKKKENIEVVNNNNNNDNSSDNNNNLSINVNEEVSVINMLGNYDSD